LVDFIVTLRAVSYRALVYLGGEGVFLGSWFSWFTKRVWNGDWLLEFSRFSEGNSEAIIWLLRGDLRVPSSCSCPLCSISLVVLFVGSGWTVCGLIRPALSCLVISLLIASSSCRGESRSLRSLLKHPARILRISSLLPLAMRPAMRLLLISE
jgi:hypothetical protein